MGGKSSISILHQGELEVKARREPKPYWKTSHQKWYVKLNGRHYPLARGKDEAWKEYHKLMLGRQKLGSNPRVHDLLTTYLAWCEVNRAPGTHRVHSMYCRLFKEDVPESLRVLDLKPKHLVGWVDGRWPAAKASSSTRRTAMRVIQRAMNWACKLGHIERNPLAGVEKPPETRRETYLWPEQYEKMLGHIRDRAFRDYVEILRHTGCRPEEARIVEARNFRAEDACWILPAKVAKGRKKPRTILLNDRALEITNRLADEWPKGPIFRNLRGNPWTGQSIVSRFRQLRPKLGFHVTAYSIRHTFATEAILRGVDLITISKLMGHNSLQMLSQVYEHVSARHDHLRDGLRRATDDETQRTP
jgi:integrase